MTRAHACTPRKTVSFPASPTDPRLAHMPFSLRLTILVLVLAGTVAAWIFERRELRDGSVIEAPAWLAGCAVDRWVRLSDGQLADAASGLRPLQLAAYIDDGRLVLSTSAEPRSGPEPDLDCAT